VDFQASGDWHCGRMSGMAKPKKAVTVKRTGIDPYVATLLEKVTVGKQELSFRKGEKIFSQGDPADSVYFIQTGRIKITVVSTAGKEAVLAMPGPHDFFGEGALVNQSLRVSTAEVLESSTVFRIDKRAMIRSLHEQPELSEKFMASLLTRNIDLEADLCDQLFNHSEKRLARVLLKLARLREHDLELDASVPVLSHETLAEMVGTTRSRVTHFMNKFRTMGLIDYNGELTIRTELLTDLVLHD
jgi:CRP/FNR family transcriptional regulator, cyclic AMP receptor protein